MVGMAERLNSKRACVIRFFCLLDALIIQTLTIWYSGNSCEAGRKDILVERRVWFRCEIYGTSSAAACLKRDP
jgi:hypothetical protein